MILRNIPVATMILASLSGCATSTVCRPISPDGTLRCYRPPPQPVGFSQAPQHEPGYAPAYPPWQTVATPMRQRWVADTPHWQPGDE